MIQTSDERIERLSTIDRTGWDAGPWDNEPDKLVWRDAATGLPCIAKRNRNGCWCGYVGLPEGHPWRDTDGFYIDADVHGGITFGPEPCDEENPEGICHVPLPGEGEVQWIGFDLNHGFDYAPGLAARERKMGFKSLQDVSEYRGLDYLVPEIERLAVQVAAARA